MTRLLCLPRPGALPDSRPSHWITAPDSREATQLTRDTEATHKEVIRVSTLCPPPLPSGLCPLCLRRVCLPRLRLCPNNVMLCNVRCDPINNCDMLPPLCRSSSDVNISNKAWCHDSCLPPSPHVMPGDCQHGHCVHTPLSCGHRTCQFVVIPTLLSSLIPGACHNCHPGHCSTGGVCRPGSMQHECYPPRARNMEQDCS